MAPVTSALKLFEIEVTFEELSSSAARPNLEFPCTVNSQFRVCSDADDPEAKVPRAPFGIDRMRRVKLMAPQELKAVGDPGGAYDALAEEMRRAVAVLGAANGPRMAQQNFNARRLLQLARSADLLAKQLIAFEAAQMLVPAPVDLVFFLSDLALLLSRTLDYRVQVSVDIVPDCPPCHADALALLDALLNLVANARDALPDGGQILLSARPATAPDGSAALAISVADNGMGMTPEFARRAVQPFVTTKRNAPYAGMGLPAADGFARQSGGHLNISCRVGSGVNATLVLPQAVPNA